mmetsp:Transcript_5372/g.13763  ORF Transcript_5372/g.13763 Transcript_5372/m.13763 type:complete len:250 (+) Transcript_5372:124-873(+)
MRQGLGQPLKFNGPQRRAPLWKVLTSSWAGCWRFRILAATIATSRRQRDALMTHRSSEELAERGLHRGDLRVKIDEPRRVLRLLLGRRLGRILRRRHRLHHLLLVRIELGDFLLESLDLHTHVDHAGQEHVCRDLRRNGRHGAALRGALVALEHGDRGWRRLRRRLGERLEHGKVRLEHRRGAAGAADEHLRRELFVLCAQVLGTDTANGRRHFLQHVKVSDHLVVAPHGGRLACGVRRKHHRGERLVG